MYQFDDNKAVNWMADVSLYTVIITNFITLEYNQETCCSVARECIPHTMNKLYIEKEMAALGATLLLLLAVFLCRVDAQFSVTIPCPSSGKKTLMSVSVYILYRY